ncbi:MAG: hypothetical protein QF733_06080 [Phycisphaerales bacterium]|nr:hypothetical protein [Phycisphaerales bacterium]
MSYTLAMDLGDLIVFGGIILSIVGSAVAAARKKRLQAGGLGASSGNPPPPAEMPAEPRPRRRVRSEPHPAPPPAPALAPASSLAVPDVHANGGPGASSKTGQRAGGFDLRQAVIAQTILGPPRGLEGWSDEV